MSGGNVVLGVASVTRSCVPPVEQPLAQAPIALTVSSHIFLASPKSIIVLSR
jgi:hypothetical protein